MANERLNRECDSLSCVLFDLDFILTNLSHGK